MRTRSDMFLDIVMPGRHAGASGLLTIVLTIGLLVVMALMVATCSGLPPPQLEQVLWSAEADIEVVTDQGSLQVAVSYVATYDEETEEVVQCPILMLRSSLYVAFDIEGVPPDPAGVIPDVCAQLYGSASFGPRPEKEPGRD